MSDSSFPKHVLMKASGVLLITLGVAAWLIMIGFVESAAEGFVIGALGALMAHQGVRLFNRARRLDASTAEQVRQRDPRPPVLYLRAFADDRMADESHAEFVAFGALRMISEEEQLAAALGPIGPVIAIGMPGEELPRLGAARLYVEQDKWQETVTALMRQAALVVIRAGTTPGLWWEIERALEEVEPRRLVLVLPFDAAAYEAFSEMLCPRLTHPLPPMEADPNGQQQSRRKIPRGQTRALLYFQTDGQPCLIPLRQGLVPFFRHSVIHRLRPFFQIALRHVFEQLGNPWRMPPVSPFYIAFVAVAATFLLLVLGALVTELL